MIIKYWLQYALLKKSFQPLLYMYFTINSECLYMWYNLDKALRSLWYEFAEHEYLDKEIHIFDK